MRNNTGSWPTNEARLDCAQRDTPANDVAMGWTRWFCVFCGDHTSAASVVDLLGGVGRWRCGGDLCAPAVQAEMLVHLCLVLRACVYC